MVGLLLCVILFKFMNKDRKIVTKYDERQIIARGKAYMFGINNNKKRFAIICIAAAICNLLGVIGPIVGGEFIKDGMISDSGTNLLCFILMVTVGVELFIKSRRENAEEAPDESGDDE